MNFNKLYRNKSVSAYLGFGNLLLSIAALIMYIVYISAADSVIAWVIVFLTLDICGEVALFFFDNDNLKLIVTLFPSFAFGFFATNSETLGSIVDRYQEIDMFGSAENFEFIIAILSVIAVSIVFAITACFMKKEKNLY